GHGLNQKFSRCWRILQDEIDSPQRFYLENGCCRSHPRKTQKIAPSKSSHHVVCAAPCVARVQFRKNLRGNRLTRSQGGALERIRGKRIGNLLKEQGSK